MLEHVCVRARLFAHTRMYVFKWVWWQFCDSIVMDGEHIQQQQKKRNERRNDIQECVVFWPVHKTFDTTVHHVANTKKQHPI